MLDLAARAATAPDSLPPGVNLTMAASYKTCTEINAICTIERTTLGYYPNVGINYFFAIGFGIAGLASFIFGTWKRTWSFMAYLTAGCMLELAGYGARIPLNTNPWNKAAFETQIVAIILAPTLICVSVYLTLKHVCLALNPALSRVRPHLYPFIFVPADVSCLLLQAIGGGLAASAGQTNFTLLQHGNRVIIAGISLQVVVLLFFGLTAGDYAFRMKKWVASSSAEGHDEGQRAAVELWGNKRFRTFVYAVTAAYSMILIRCIYRIAEMAGGWGNHIMQDEPSFIVLEGFMILLASLILAFFPPGILFPQMAMAMSKSAAKKLAAAKKSDKLKGESGNLQTSADEDPELGTGSSRPLTIDEKHA
ncbi:sphingoid long-chain base transporter RSB1 [Naviculisporaceae sp. PSN 640]